jgi:Uma2 family endonuclease
MGVRHPARPVASTQLTLKEWAQLADEIEGELVDGRLEQEEVSNTAHERVVAWLIWRLMTWVGGRGGEVTGSDRKYAVSARRGRKPDVSVFLPGRPRLAAADRLTAVPPDIAVEVITPTPRDTARDRIDKAREYARFGVRWYWLVDPAMRTFEVYELASKATYVRTAAGSGGRLSVPGCRGLKLDLDALWRYVGG